MREGWLVSGGLLTEWSVSKRDGCVCPPRLTEWSVRGGVCVFSSLLTEWSVTLSGQLVREVVVYVLPG